jgi:glycosyltransferase involved in cell wall biosynthesis
VLKIANVCLSRSWGGLEMSALKWAENLARRGHEVRNALVAGSRMSEEARSRRLAQVTVPLMSKSFDPRASAKIRGLVGREGIDVVQAHRSKDLWVLWLALVGNSRPKLFYASHMLFKTTTKKDLLHSLVYRRLDGVIVLGEVGKRCFAAATSVPPGKITVIPNGFDVDAFDVPPGERDAVRSEMGLAASDLVIGCTSRIDVQKGQLELVEAFRLALRHFTNARLVLVGEPTMHEGLQYMDFLKRKVAEYGLDSRIVFTGFRRDVPRILAGLDVFVMPSYEETFGNCLVEAMLAGLPCVATDAGGAPEIVEGGRVGLLAEPRSVESLARALGLLLENPGLRRDLGARARESARLRFNLDGVLDRAERLYEGCVSGGETGR